MLLVSDFKNNKVLSGNSFKNKNRTAYQHRLIGRIY